MYTNNCNCNCNYECNCNYNYNYNYKTITIHKIDAYTKNCLEGATFALMENCQVIKTAQTNENGIAQFCVKPCHEYQLKEICPPYHYKKNDHTYYLRIGRCGEIYVDGVLTNKIFVPNEREHPMEKCDPPIPSELYEGDNYIRGKGTPFSRIGITLPSGKTKYTIVNEEGDWAISLKYPLTAGQKVTVWTEKENMLPSDRVDVIVLAKLVHTINYDSNGGVGSYTETNISHGSFYTIKNAESVNISPLIGVKFKEWNTSIDGSGTSYQAGDSITVNADIILYAQWEQI